MRVWFSVAHITLATTVAACGSGSASDDEGKTESGSAAESSAPGLDSAMGLDASSSGLDGAQGMDSFIPAPDSSNPGPDATTAPDSSNPGPDATTMLDGGGVDVSTTDAPGADASGTDATSDAGTDGGSAIYQPCPSDGSPCKILPLGDSITYGVNDEGNAGYRGPLFMSVVAAGQRITFTGSLSDGPNTVSGQTFPKNNEGHSGWGISEVNPNSGGNAGIATVIPSPAFGSGSGGVPNIILLHIGTNDQGSFAATQMTSDLTGLLDKIIANAPDALLVVAQIIPLGYGTNDVIKAYNQAIPGVVQQRAAAGKHIVPVDMYTAFNTSTMLGSDSIHPNSTGYQFMADHWYSVIGPLLPK